MTDRNQFGFCCCSGAFDKLVGTGVVEVTNSVPSVFPVDAFRVPFGKTDNSGKLQTDANFIYNPTFQSLQVVGATGAVSEDNDRATIRVQAGHNNTAGALDIYSTNPLGGEFLIRWFRNTGGQPTGLQSLTQPAAYLNKDGALYGNIFVVLSGATTGLGQNFRVTPPSLDPCLLGIWSDVQYAQVLRVPPSGIGGLAYLKCLTGIAASQAVLLEEFGKLTLGVAATGTIILDPVTGVSTTTIVGTGTIPGTMLATAAKTSNFLLGSSAAAGTITDRAISKANLAYWESNANIVINAGGGQLDVAASGIDVFSLISNAIYFRVFGTLANPILTSTGGNGFRFLNGTNGCALVANSADGFTCESGPKISMYGVPTVARQTVTGSRLVNPALASLLTALQNTGIIIDGTVV